MSSWFRWSTSCTDLSHLKVCGFSLLSEFGIVLPQSPGKLRSKPKRIVGFIMAVLRMDQSADIKVAPFGSYRRCRLTGQLCAESRKCSA